ncbi:MAG: hypothetical protein IJN59_04070, partial [Oscillospiraceae bacterium]|nr:hypothetical protein [Oscillospiraceae bacterium]
PALPEGITLDVQAGVQARIDTYDGNQTGLRFTTIATATDWSMIDEMGTAIVIAGTTPGVDTTLAVPARVDWDGDFLHNFTKNEEGLRDFEDGIVSDKAAITYTGVISNIKEANKDVDFQAYAYVIVDGKTYYSTTSATGNYNDIFGAAQDDPTIA